MKNKAVYPGTFDPITLGHVDIIKRAALMYDEVTVAVSASYHKKLLFDAETRIKLVEEAVKGLKNVKVDSFNGLLVNYMKKNKKRIVIRGLRALSDFEYEFQLALLNKKMVKNLEMVYLMTDEKYLYVSSSAVKEIAMHGGNTIKFVPKAAAIALNKVYNKTFSYNKTL